MSLSSSQPNTDIIPDASLASASGSGVSQAAMEIASFEKFIKEYFDKAARP